MISNIEFIDIINPDTHNHVKTLPTFRKNIPNIINLNKNIKYIHKNYNSIHLLNYYIHTKLHSSNIDIVSYSNVISNILLGKYLKINFQIEVIKDRNIIFLNNITDINDNEFVLNNYKKQQIFKDALLVNNKNIRYGVSKVKIGNYNLLVGGKIDATIFKNNINILVIHKLTYKILLEMYINGIITNTYKILYAIINKDNTVQYYNSLKITDINDMLSLDINIGISFFNTVIEYIKSVNKHKFILSYNATLNTFII